MESNIDAPTQNPFASEAVDPLPSAYSTPYPSNSHDAQTIEPSIQAPAPRLEQSYEPQSQATPLQPPQRTRAPQSQYYIVFSVAGIERSNAKNPIIRFDAKTNLPRFRAPLVRDIRRTHHELIKLQDHLIFANPECFVPALPPPVTSAGAGTEEDEKRMKAELQRWFDIISSNPVLIRDEEIMLFVESDFGYSPVHDHGAPTAGLRRKAKKQFAPPPDDCIELAEARPIIKSFHLTTQDATVKLEKISKLRVVLSRAEQDFATKISSVGQIEQHSGLSRAYRQLSKAFLQKADITSGQSTAELSTFADQLALLSQSAFIAKETLTTRHFLIREFINAQNASRTKYAALQRMKSGTKIDEAKVDEALASYEDAKARETDLQQKVARVTGNLLYERRIWTARIAKDGKSAIREYVERMIEIERRTLGALEIIRPDIRSIDASGGLSWLGRESHKSVAQARPEGTQVEGRRRGGSLGVSQGPRGDAWSGVERRRSYRGDRRDSTSKSPVRDRESDDGQEEELEDGKLDARSAAMMLSTQL